MLHCAVPVEAEITCVSTDTRDLPAGCLFVALRGEKFDGHAFVEQAIAAGAVAAVTDRQVGDCPCLVVKDTGRALQQITRFYREKFHPILVGITGSVGKTTTKEMIACVLESQFCTLKTQGNLNNEIGQPKTLLGLEDCHQAAVIEMGMSHSRDQPHGTDSRTQHWCHYQHWLFPHRKPQDTGGDPAGKAGDPGRHGGRCSAGGQRR
ncbi:MAG: Mur ligase family protein [Ruminococcus callidus]